MDFLWFVWSVTVYVRVCGLALTIYRKVKINAEHSIIKIFSQNLKVLLTKVPFVDFSGQLFSLS